MKRPKRAIALLVAGALACVQAAQAMDLIRAEAVAAAEAPARVAEDPRTPLLAALSRDDVAAALVARGVSVDEARARVRALSDAEATRLLAEIDRAPAGASEVVGTLALVFVLLVFTDILGFTRIFPFIKPAS